MRELVVSGELDLHASLYSGQSFLWRSEGDVNPIHFTGMAGSSIIIRESHPGKIELSSDSELIAGWTPEEWFRHYFSLDVDTERLFPESLRTRYPDLMGRLSAYRGLRVLRQDPFETMISFMCAQGIGMKLIRRQVSMLCRRYGEKVAREFGGLSLTLHRFPTPSRLAAADPDELRTCTNNNLIRARNIISASRRVAEGCVDFNALTGPEVPLERVRSTLSGCAGIGLKIADCIALFGLGRFDAFPIDTHVHQFLREWFDVPEASRPLSERNYRILSERAAELFGRELAGYAGHHLFHCWRTEVKRLQAF